LSGIWLWERRRPKASFMRDVVGEEKNSFSTKANKDERESHRARVFKTSGFAKSSGRDISAI